SVSSRDRRSHPVPLPRARTRGRSRRTPPAAAAPCRRGEPAPRDPVDGGIGVADLVDPDERPVHDREEVQDRDEPEERHLRRCSARLPWLTSIARYRTTVACRCAGPPGSLLYGGRHGDYTAALRRRASRGETLPDEPRPRTPRT